MDRSVESIGKCSLDVDADFSDISDTSESVNFPTTVSTKNITKDFTSDMNERCELSYFCDQGSEKIHLLTNADVSASRGKKPSYLNLACCVNGYSNLTTYDSKIRKDINKSREVSPIRPTVAGMQCCKKYSSLAYPEVLVSKTSKIKNEILTLSTHSKANNENGNSDPWTEYYLSKFTSASSENIPQIKTQSFIQQRVEKLYGSTAQRLYSPKNLKLKLGYISHNDCNKSITLECSKKLQIFSPIKDCNKFSKNGKPASESDAPAIEENRKPTFEADTSVTKEITDINNLIDLPVLRHLSQEFRAQLPTISPKRNIKISDDKNCPPKFKSHEIKEVDCSTQTFFDSLNAHTTRVPYQSNEANLLQSLDTSQRVFDGKYILHEKDGNYFLNILKSEQNRLLSLADEAENCLVSLSTNTQVAEEILGLLRSASGKARLLVSRKMKQFEGLCHNNLNKSPNEQFPTRIEDLQGFWDLVYLQIEQIDAIFYEIENLRANNWKTPEDVVPAAFTKKHPNSLKYIVKKPKSAAKNETTSTNKQCVQSDTAQRREVQRKQLMELKRKNKMAMLSLAQSSKDIANASNSFLSSNVR